MADTNTNLFRTGEPVNADQMTKLLELELERKRAEWKKQGSRNRAIRTNSFIALFVLLVACVVIYFVMMSQLSGARSARPTPAQASQR